MCLLDDRPHRRTVDMARRPLDYGDDPRMIELAGELQRRSVKSSRSQFGWPKTQSKETLDI